MKYCVRETTREKTIRKYYIQEDKNRRAVINKIATDKQWDWKKVLHSFSNILVPVVEILCRGV